MGSFSIKYMRDCYNGKIKEFEDKIKECEKGIEFYKEKIESLAYIKKYLIRVYKNDNLIDAWDEEIDSRKLNFKIDKLYDELREDNTDKLYIVADVFLEEEEKNI